MGWKKERGSLTVEAAIVLVIFIFGYAAIVSLTSFIRAQMIIQYSITQAARDISSYCYIVSKTGLMEDSARLDSEAGEFKKSTDNVIDTVAKLYDAIEMGSGEITSAVDKIDVNANIQTVMDSIQDVENVTEEEYQKIATAANAVMSEGEAYFNEPEKILKGLTAVVKDEGFSLAKSYLVAAPISKALVRKQIELYENNSQGKDILETLGVVDGFDGLNFAGCTLFNDGKAVTVQVAYTMKVKYPGFDKKEFHFVQTASTEAWGSKNRKRPWRQ